MTSICINACGSDGHLLFPLRSKLDAFPIVKRKDEDQWRTCRTKDTILEIYAALAAAMQSGQPDWTRLNPTPADLRVAHPMSKANE